jgi:hypothetical protein
MIKNTTTSNRNVNVNVNGGKIKIHMIETNSNSTDKEREKEVERFKQEQDLNARDMNYDWVNEQDMQIFAKVRISIQPGFNGVESNSTPSPRIGFIR